MQLFRCRIHLQIHKESVKCLEFLRMNRIETVSEQFIQSGLREIGGLLPSELQEGILHQAPTRYDLAARLTNEEYKFESRVDGV